MSASKTKETIKSLVNKKVINFIGRKKAPNGKYVNEYDIVDIWDKNMEYFLNKKKEWLSRFSRDGHQKTVTDTSDSHQKTVTGGCDGREVATKKILNIPILNIPLCETSSQDEKIKNSSSLGDEPTETETPNLTLGDEPTEIETPNLTLGHKTTEAAISSPIPTLVNKSVGHEIPPFNASEYLMTSNKQIIRRIGMYISFKGIKVDNKKQIKALIGVHYDFAKELEGYTDQEVIMAMKHLKETATYDWKVSSILKALVGRDEEGNFRDKGFKNNYPQKASTLSSQIQKASVQVEV
jgi:hypothetical protein